MGSWRSPFWTSRSGPGIPSAACSSRRTMLTLTLTLTACSWSSAPPSSGSESDRIRKLLECFGRHSLIEKPCKASWDQLQLLMDTLAELDACNRTLVTHLEKTSQRSAFSIGLLTNCKAPPFPPRHSRGYSHALHLLMSASICMQTCKVLKSHSGKGASNSGLTLTGNASSSRAAQVNCEGSQRAKRCGQKNTGEHYLAEPQCCVGS